MAEREKEETRGWSVVLKMIDQPAAEPSVADQSEPPTVDAPKNRGASKAPPRSKVEPRVEERTVIDKRMASVLSQRPVPSPIAGPIEDLDQSIETDGRLLLPEIPRDDTAPVPLDFADRTSLDRQERTEIGAAPKPRTYSEPLKPLPGEDTVDDLALTLTPADRGSSVAPRPKVAGGPVVLPADRPPTKSGPEPKASKVKITPSDPKRASGEVRVTAAGSGTPVRPGSAMKITPSLAPPLEDAPVVQSAPIPQHLLAELGPVEKLRDHEMTMLDLAAQIGLAPEPQRPKVDGEEPPAALGAKNEPAIRMPLPEQGAKVADMLEEEVKEQAVRALNSPFRPKDASLDGLPHLVKVTQGAAKLIPVIIAAFVMFATVGVVITLFTGGGSGGTEHVTLKFLPVQNADGSLTANPNLPPPVFTIETEPAGVLVVLDRKILGPTPLTFELPMRADRVGIELTGPYYETWISEIVREPTGEMHAKAKLKKKR